MFQFQSTLYYQKEKKKLNITTKLKKFKLSELFYIFYIHFDK